MLDAANGGTYPAIVWRSTALRLALVVVPAWFTVAMLVFTTPWREKLIVGLVFAVALAWPAAGLLVAAAVAPLGHLVAMLAGIDAFRVSEAVVLAFMTGWLLRAPEDRPGPRVAAVFGWPLAACVVMSIAVQAWHLGHHRGAVENAIDLIFHEYYLIDDPIGFVDGARLLEGLALSVAIVTLFRQRPMLAVTLPIVLAGSAVVAAASSVLLWQGIAPAVVLARYARIGYRVSAHVGDVNAAGSYFTMIACLALGMAARAAGRARGVWIAATAACAIGLWFTESRTALAATAIVVPLAAAWALSTHWKPTLRLAALTVLLITAIAAGAVRARLLESDPTYRGSGFRQQFNAASLRMIAARPLFGVGIGQYYRSSALFLSPQLAFTYGFENAHNSFLQIGAELGILGLLIFSAWIGAGIVRAGRALARAPGDMRLLGTSAGLAAFAGTCLTGHPLVVDEVAFPFWMQFGLVLALAGSTLLDAEPTEEAALGMRHAPRAFSYAGAAVGMCVLAAALVSARRGPVEPPALQAVDGFYGWEAGDDGRRFRWTRQYASLFVPADVTRVYIPVRVPTNIPAIAPMGVEVMTSGIDGGRTAVGDSWAILNVALPDVAPPSRFKRIDLRVDRAWQPALYLSGSADLRSVGVQVGEYRLFRER